MRSAPLALFTCLCSAREERLTTVMLWLWTVAVGVVVALTAFAVIFGVGQLTMLKFQIIKSCAPSAGLCILDRSYS